MKKLVFIGGSIAAAMMLMMGLAVTTLIAAAVMMGNSYGEKIEFKNGELYYTENVTRDQAELLAEFLDNLYGELENEKSFQLDRRGDTLIVKMCAQSKAWESDELDFSFMALEILIQKDVFRENNVVFELCDQRFQTKKTIDEIPLKDAAQEKADDDPAN